MDPHGYGAYHGGPPPEAFPSHLQEQNSMMQNWYQDPHSSFHQQPPGQGYQPGHGPPPFWHQDGSSRPPPPFPPSFSPFYPPQHESGHFPPPPPPQSSHFSPYPTPQSSSFRETEQYHPRWTADSSSFGENSQHARSSASFGESTHYPPHMTSRSSSSREHAQPEIHSVSEHRDYFKNLSFEDQAGSPSVQARDLPSFYRPSLSHRISSPERERPATLQRELMLENEFGLSEDAELPKGQLVRIFCKHSRSFNLTVEDNRVVMMEANAGDEFQQWIRDDRYSIRVRDNYGYPAFMLINKGSKKALKHGPGQLEEVQLISYTPGLQDDDLFWTESQDFSEGFRTVRKATDTLLNLSVSCGNNIENGCVLILDTWHKTDNQLWKIFPV